MPLRLTIFVCCPCINFLMAGLCHRNYYVESKAKKTCIATSKANRPNFRILTSMQVCEALDLERHDLITHLA